MRWQQDNCTKDVIGYAVGLAAERTERAAYMTGEGTELTNSEAAAAVLPREEAIALMMRIRNSEHWLAPEQFKICFLVPVSKELPLDMCTFSGY